MIGRREGSPAPRANHGKTGRYPRWTRRAPGPPGGHWHRAGHGRTIGGIEPW